MIGGMSVQPPGVVAGRVYQRDSNPTYPDYGPAWVANSYGLTVEAMTDDLRSHFISINRASDEFTPDEVAVMWAQWRERPYDGPAESQRESGITVHRLLDEGWI